MEAALLFVFDASAFASDAEGPGAGVDAAACDRHMPRHGHHNRTWNVPASVVTSTGSELQPSYSAQHSYSVTTPPCAPGPWQPIVNGDTDCTW